MSHERFTPGPWSASAPDGTYHDVIRIFADSDPEGALPVAICPQRQSAIMSVFAGQTDATTEAAANARLIAAAPDLLALLIEAGDFIQPFNRAEELLDRIDAVIGKATGQTIMSHEMGDK